VSRQVEQDGNAVDVAEAGERLCDPQPHPLVLVFVLQRLLQRRQGGPVAQASQGGGRLLTHRRRLVVQRLDQIGQDARVGGRGDFPYGGDPHTFVRVLERPTQFLHAAADGMLRSRDGRGCTGGSAT